MIFLNVFVVANLERELNGVLDDGVDFEVKEPWRFLARLEESIGLEMENNYVKIM